MIKSDVVNVGKMRQDIGWSAANIDNSQSWFDPEYVIYENVPNLVCPNCSLCKAIDLRHRKHAAKSGSNLRGLVKHDLKLVGELAQTASLSAPFNPDQRVLWASPELRPCVSNLATSLSPFEM